MGVTMVVCDWTGCGRMLNGELCKFVEGKPYCNEHAAIREDRTIRPGEDYKEE